MNSSMTIRGPAKFDRRLMLQGMAALGLGGCATAGLPGAAALSAGGNRGIGMAPPLPLAKLRADPERIFDITVCLRPFRPAGPRLDVEQIGDTLVVHNYGHGGSGWSLSWGSSAIAVGKALAGSPRSVAVLGSGPLGLTSALLAQSAGTPVTIYARELAPETSSMRATGSFTPSSRIALADGADPSFPALWEQMARTSLKRFGNMLGVTGDPVRWVDRYIVSDGQPSMAAPSRPAGETALRFASLDSRLSDVMPAEETLDPASTPFTGTTSVRRQTNLMFNLSSYAHTLQTMFRLAGGKIVRREFQSPTQLGELSEKTVINCTGLGARTLFGDTSMVPVRGQIAWMVPQAGFDYGLLYRGISVLPRSDGIVVQPISGGDMRGYGDENLMPDRAEAEASVMALAQLYARFGTSPAA